MKGGNAVAIPDGNSTSAAIWSLSALYHHGGKSRFRAKPVCNRAKGSAVQNPKSLRKQGAPDFAVRAQPFAFAHLLIEPGMRPAASRNVVTPLRSVRSVPVTRPARSRKVVTPLESIRLVPMVRPAPFGRYSSAPAAPALDRLRDLLWDGLGRAGQRRETKTLSPFAAWPNVAVRFKMLIKWRVGLTLGLERSLMHGGSLPKCAVK